MARARRGQGEGSITQRTDGSWHGRVSMGYGSDGKHRRRSVYGKTKAEVATKLRELQCAGPVGDAGALTLGDYLGRYLATAKDRLGAATHERYEELVRLHLTPAASKLKLAKVTALSVEELHRRMAEAGASASTVQAAHRVLSAALRRAVKLRLITSNPCADAAKPKPKKTETAFLTPEQAAQFLKVAQGRSDYALYCVAVAGGFRQGELFALTWGDFDAATGVVAVRRSLSRVKAGASFKEPKSAAGRRSVGLPPTARAALAAHKPAGAAPDHLIFGDTEGNPLRKSNFIRRSFQPLLAKCRAACRGAGLAEPPAGFTFHGLRHTHASFLVSRGMSLKAVSHRLGHASVEVTLAVYAHVMPNDDARLAAESEGVFAGQLA